MERVSILIDGSNFYHLVLKKLSLEESQFNFDAFANFLANGRTITEKGKRFYTGTVREKEGDARSRVAMSKQTAFFTKLSKVNWELKTSKLKIRFEEIHIDKRVVEYKELQKAGITRITVERLREKGIDVKLATDLIVGAVDDQYDTAIIVSSDSDLIPAIDWVRLRKKKKVEYIGFSVLDEKNPKNSTRPLLSLINKTDLQRTLVKSDLDSFIEKNLFTKQV